MSHIAVDLKVIEVHAPAVARASGQSEDRVLAGLIRLWHRCWSVTRETLTRTEIAGAFGPEGLDQLIGAMEVQFLEKQEDGSYRVRGADQYLRIKAARRRGAEKTNRARVERRSSDAPATLNRTLPDALTPNTEHRTPNTEELRSIDSAVAFWRWAQDERHRIAELPRETPPHPRALSTWANTALLEVSGDFERLRDGYRRFLVSPFWRNDARLKVPWSGWVKCWREFITSTAPPVVDRSKPIKAPVAAEAVDWSSQTAGEVAL